MKSAVVIFLLAASARAATPVGTLALAEISAAPSAIPSAEAPIAALFPPALAPAALAAAPSASIPSVAPLLAAPAIVPAALGGGAAPQALVKTSALERLQALAPVLAAATGDDEVRSLYEGAASADADVVRSGLSDEQLGMISHHSKAGRPLGIDEFLATVPLERNGYILGTTGGHTYDAAAKATGLTHYQEVYGELYGKIRVDATDQFMDFLTRSGDPILFLVPDDALTHPQAKMTKEELEWLFAHPDRMKDVYFVFGAYGSAREGPTEAQLTERFAARRGALARPADATRIAQRRRHRGSYDPRDVREISGVERLEAIEEFVGALLRARFAQERHSAGKLDFASDRGYYELQRSARGLFLTLPSEAADARAREVFISAEEEPDLFAATAARIAAAN